MLTVEDYGKIRRAHRDGMSIRRIAKTFHHSKRKVREALQNSEPAGYRRRKPPSAPVLGAYMALIDAILLSDVSAPRKQRHTAMQVFRRLRDEQGYVGSYDQVRRYIKAHRKRLRETFVPLAVRPGQRMECDFGHIYVDFPEGRKHIPVLLCTWSYSNRVFAIALKSERLEAVLHGMVESFSYFGCVPLEVWWDNPKTLVTSVLKGRERVVHPRYLALASHYVFAPHFCMPAKGQEKSRVENRVYDLQRRFCTPVPSFADLAALNVYLRERCDSECGRRIAGQTETIGARFDVDLAHAAALPRHAFEACVWRAAVVDKYQSVRFDCVRYSAPAHLAFETVQVKAYVDRIELLAHGRVVARHRRSYAPSSQVLDPLHYLALLKRKPAALDHSEVFSGWRLPACFERLRKALEAAHGPSEGARRYIRVLGMVSPHGVSAVAESIEQALSRSMLDVESLILQIERRAGRDIVCAADVDLSDLSADARRVSVDAPNLDRFNQLLTDQAQGESHA